MKYKTLTLIKSKRSETDVIMDRTVDIDEDAFGAVEEVNGEDEAGEGHTSEAFELNIDN